jgi:hypothetical protein
LYRYFRLPRGEWQLATPRRNTLTLSRLIPRFILGRHALLAAVTLLGASAVASADVVQYTLNFAPGATYDPVGGFSFDPNKASGTQFSNFLITMGSTVFDLDSAANSISSGALTGACLSSSDGAGFVHALTTPGCNSMWSVFSPQEVKITVCSATFLCDDRSVTEFNFSVNLTLDSGHVSATATAPEPGMVPLLSIGILALVAIRVVQDRAAARLRAPQS